MNISQIVQKIQGILIRVAKSSVIELGADIVQATPFDTGRARQSWTDDGFVFGGRYKFYSVLEYIQPLEYGHSDKAPHGMVRINVKRWPQIVYRNAKAI